MSAATQIQIHWDELAALVGGAKLRAATAADAVDGVQPQQIAEPESSAEVAAILKWAASRGVAVIPRGGGTKLSWGNPPARADLVLSIARMNKVLEHAWADLTVTVEAGCAIEQLQQTLAQHGQQLAIDPLWPERATVGGILATNDSGSMRVRFGGLRDLIIGITVVLTDGTVAHSGGKVVKNVAGYDLQKLMTGSLGTLGVITEAVFRLYPLPKETRTLSFAVRDYDEMQRLLLAIQDSTLEHTGLQARVGNFKVTVDVRFSGTPAGLEVRTKHATALAVAQVASTSPEVWLTRESVFAAGSDVASNAATCKFSVLPTALEQFCSAVDETCDAFSAQRQMVIQATGLGNLRLDAAEPRAVTSAIARIRTAAESGGGSLVILNCPREFKNVLDVWGGTGDALPLMRRVKKQFDPGGTLNPGRFVGGI